MMPAKRVPADVGEYIAAFPVDVRRKLQTVRRSIRKAVPGAKESISHGMPSFTLESTHFIAFAAWSQHLSVYPVPKGTEALSKQMKRYRAGRGTLQFPLDNPIPYPLIVEVAKALAKEKLARAEARRRKTKSA